MPHHDFGFIVRTARDLTATLRKAQPSLTKAHDPYLKGALAHEIGRPANLHISKGDPPCFIVHGDADFVVPLNQSELLHAALKKAGVPSTLYVVKGGNHGFSKGEESVDEIVKRVADFFDSQFKQTGR